MMIPWCAGSTALPGMVCGSAPTGAKTCRANSSRPKRLATSTVAYPSALGGGGKTLAVLLRQGRIHQIPAGLEGAAQDGVAGFIGRAFQVVQGRLRSQG